MAEVLFVVSPTLLDELVADMEEMFGERAGLTDLMYGEEVELIGPVLVHPNPLLPQPDVIVERKE